MSINQKNKKGYIALVSLLLVAAVGLTISIAVSLRGMEELQMSFASSQASVSSHLAGSCLEEGLNRLRQNWSDFGSINLSIGDNLCIINVVAFDGSSADLEVYGDNNIFRQKISVSVDSDLEVASWQSF